MNYDSIILELMGRIQTLEEEVRQQGRRLDALERARTGGEESSERSAAPYAATTDEMIDACYAKGVYAWKKGITSPYEMRPLALEISRQLGMNKNSANMYLYVVVSMLNGKVYKRAISERATERYFQKIQQDFGPAALAGAVRAARQHIQYRRGLGHQVAGLSALCDRFDRPAPGQQG